MNNACDSAEEPAKMTTTAAEPGRDEPHLHADSGPQEDQPFATRDAEHGSQSVRPERMLEVETTNPSNLQDVSRPEVDQPSATPDLEYRLLEPVSQLETGNPLPPPCKNRLHARLQDHLALVKWCAENRRRIRALRGLGSSSSSSSEDDWAADLELSASDTEQNGTVERGDGPCGSESYEAVVHRRGPRRSAEARSVLRGDGPSSAEGNLPAIHGDGRSLGEEDGALSHRPHMSHTAEDWTAVHSEGRNRTKQEWTLQHLDTPREEDWSIVHGDGPDVNEEDRYELIPIYEHPMVHFHGLIHTVEEYPIAELVYIDEQIINGEGGPAVNIDEQIFNGENSPSNINEQIFNGENSPSVNIDEQIFNGEDTPAVNIDEPIRNEEGCPGVLTNDSIEGEELPEPCCTGAKQDSYLEDTVDSVMNHSKAKSI